ncbi:MAG: TRAP transporter small permease [Oscillospiraceae bacterium]|nr:TRAP transporter small permease [Oscillospiraceae bacterium]
MWQKLDRIMAGIGTVLSVISVGIVVILGILQVLFRFVLKISVPWTEEMMRALFIYIVFFGLILVERENGEVRTTMLIEKLPYKAYHVWESVVAVLSILFNVLVLIGCFQAMKVTNTTLSALPQISMRMFFYPMVISLPLMVIYQIYHMIGHIRKLSGKPGEEAET